MPDLPTRPTGLEEQGIVGPWYRDLSKQQLLPAELPRAASAGPFSAPASGPGVLRWCVLEKWRRDLLVLPSLARPSGR